MASGACCNDMQYSLLNQDWLPCWAFFCDRSMEVAAGVTSKFIKWLLSILRKSIVSLRMIL